MAKEDSHQPILLYSSSKDSRTIIEKLEAHPKLRVDYVEVGEPARFRIPCILDRSGVPWEGKDGVEAFLELFGDSKSTE